jgi:hypothetical protein
MKAWQIVLSTAFLLSLLSLGNATILSVALDGSQPYTVIQEAINASAHGDTVLVYPGRYYENIRFYGKNIILASLELTTGNLDYKYNTIIDGNQNGSVIQIRNGESSATIHGVTITNGSGFYYDVYDETYGGGILIGALNSVNNIRIVNCIITGNNANSGGGMQVDRCNLFLSGTLVANNIASVGGGVKLSGSFITPYQVTFDPVYRCSIYSNKAAVGSDIYSTNLNVIPVIVDTFTVTNPSNFYAAAVPASSNIENPYTFDILHSVHTEINHDLYVAPWGDDANDGLSEATPLKTVFQAVYNIASDPVNPKTVHLAEGYYSKSQNQQLFPVPIKNWTRLTGSERDDVILDAESANYGISINPYSHDFLIQKLSITNCRYGIMCSQSSNIHIADVLINNVNNIQFAVGYYGYENVNQELSNVKISNVYSQWLTNGITLHQKNGYARLANVEISHVRALVKSTPCMITVMGTSEVSISESTFQDNTNSCADLQYGILYISPFDSYCQRLRIDIANSSFYNNQQSLSNFMGLVHALNDTTFVRNCTFAGNSGGSSALTVKGNAVFENNIFWNPQLPYELTAYYSSTEGISGRLEFDNNCIRNGLSGIYNMSPLNEIVWHDNNLALDPQFVGSGSHPYRLSAASPLIDIGLQPALFEPSYDAGGNERVWDGDGDGSAVIDLGAYEYQPIVSPYNLSAELWNQQILLGWQMPEDSRSLTGFRIYRNNQAYADIPDPGCRLFRDYSPVNDTLSYYVVALYGEVESEPTNSVTVIVSGVANSDETMVPVISRVSVSPNPFSDLAVISYELGKQSEVELKLYNLKGQLVRILHQGNQSKGLQTLAWEGCDDSGRHVASGIYILQLRLDGKAQQAMKLVKW